MKIARYKNIEYDYEEESEVTDWKENADNWVRLTEIIEVDFIDLTAEEIIPPQVAAIDKAVAEETKRHAEKLEVLAVAKSKLLSITHIA